MNTIQSFKKGLSRVARYREEQKVDLALHEVEEMLKTWPGNAPLYIQWADLVQLQEKPAQSLDEVRKALQSAVAFGKDSPAGAIELGHFLDSVNDDPRAASRSFAEGVRTARLLLIEGLLGQTRSLLQVGRRKEAERCLAELLYLVGRDSSSERGKSADSTPDILFREPGGQIVMFRLAGPFASRIEDLLREVFPNRSA